MLNRILLILLIVSSSSLVGQTTLKFSTSCNTSNDTSYVIDKLRFYVSNIAFETKTGETIKDTIIAYLIDKEDSNSFTIDFPTISRSSIRAVHLTLGTDSLTNISGVLDGDLDPINGMYWSWNTGYINFKIEGKRNIHSKTTSFEYHIGGYLTPFPTSRQLAFSTLDSSDSININIDLNYLFSHFNMDKNPSVLIPGKLSSDLSKLIQQSFVLEK
ncbi:MAG: hypothetical protein MK066_05740 [Crocinitomicaceae bacterium]|nr:hypothetical protein [Crocinitomicaceae bacterium]